MNFYTGGEPPPKSSGATVDSHMNENRDPEIHVGPDAMLKPKPSTREGDGPALDPLRLRRAQAAVGQMRPAFLTWARGEANSIRRLLNASGVDTGGWTACRSKVCGDVEMIGELGGTFGYPLITFICDSLKGYLDNRSGIDDTDIEIVHRHIAALQAVTSDDVRGGGGSFGHRIRTDIGRMTARAAG